MFDPRKITEHDEACDEPLLANISNISKPQKRALVSLLGGPAERKMGSTNARWVIAELGSTWRIAEKTMSTLADRGLVRIGTTAQLTRRGKWYAISCAVRESDALWKAEIECS